MPRIKPYQGTSYERLSTLIRNAQKPALPKSVTFVFESLVGEVDSEVTSIVAVAKVNKRVDPAETLQYTRLSLGVLFHLPVGELLPFGQMSFPTTVHAILPLINEALGLNLIPEELEDTELPTIPVNGLPLTVTSVSLAWLPGTYLFAYPPGADQPVARSEQGAIPTDERRRMRLLEKPLV